MPKKTARITKAKPLTPKQLQFVREYIIDFNGLQSAIRAGYSQKTAKEQASWLLTNPNVQAEINKAIQKRAAKTERSADEVIRALWEMAELDIAHFMTVDHSGSIQAIPLDQIPPEKRKYINKIKGKRTIRESASGQDMTMIEDIEYGLPEKKGTYELLSRHYGLLVDKKEIDLKQPLTVNIVKFAGETGKNGDNPTK